MGSCFSPAAGAVWGGGLWDLQEFEFYWRKWRLHVNALRLESRFNESSQSPVLLSCLPCPVSPTGTHQVSLEL